MFLSLYFILSWNYVWNKHSTLFIPQYNIRLTTYNIVTIIVGWIGSSNRNNIS